MPSSPRPAAFDFSGIFSRPPPATLALMILTGVASLAVMFGSGGLALTPARLALDFAPSQMLVEPRPWTAATWLFVAASPFQLLLYEVFGLWMFGSRLEQMFGTKRYLLYFFTTGIGAALATTALSFAMPALRELPPGVFQGTWVALEVIILAWVLMNWHATVYLYFFPVRAPVLLAISIVIPVLYAVMGIWIPFVPVVFGMALGFLMLRRRRGSSLMRRLRAALDERRFRRRTRHLRIVRPSKTDSDDRPRYLQ